LYKTNPGTCDVEWLCFMKIFETKKLKSSELMGLTIVHVFKLD